jgi:hypothetical protein
LVLPFDKDPFIMRAVSLHFTQHPATGERSPLMQVFDAIARMAGGLSGCPLTPALPRKATAR